MSRPAWRGDDGGAAQPISTPGGAAQLTFSALPDDASELTVGFYNIGIQLSEVGGSKWKTREQRLREDIIKAADTHALDILCFSELGELGVGIAAKLAEGNVDTWIRNLLAGSAVSPVAIYADGHYATLVLSDRIKVLQYQVVKGFMATQTDRCFQHFRVQTDEREKPISIVNCHTPSSQKRKLTVDGRKQYFTAFHKACAGDPFIWGGDFNTGLVQLATFLEGIDVRYATDTSDAQPGSLQTVFSHPIRFKHGDLAVTHGLCSTQVNSTVGFSFNGASDAHDLVVAKVFGNMIREHGQEQQTWPMPTHPTPRPEPKTSSSNSAAQPRPEPKISSSSSAAQPAQQQQPPPPPKRVTFALKSSDRMDEATQPKWQKPSSKSAAQLADALNSSGRMGDAQQPKWPMPTRPTPLLQPEVSSSSSAAQPAQQKPADSTAPPILSPCSLPPGLDVQRAEPKHHRVNTIFGADDPNIAPLQDLLEQIGSQFLFGKVANIVASTTGCYELATVPCIVQKLEAFLEIVEQQRSRHLRRHPSLTPDASFSDEDMQELHRLWMEDHENWMNEETLANYNWWLSGTYRGDHQKAHQIRRGAFSAFLFQIIGNKHVLLAAIQHPICSAAQPADAIQRFMHAWEKEKSSEDYKKRVQISERLTKKRRALKQAAHTARQELVRGKKVHAAISKGSQERAALSDKDKALLEDFISGKLERVRDECDAAFGWNREMRIAVGNTASKLGR